MKRYSDTILVCDLKPLFFREERSINSSGDGEEKENREGMNEFENVWMQSSIKLPEPCNLMGVVLVKKYKIHIFGGCDGRKSLHQHLVFDVREILGNLREVEKVVEVM